jgi:hypothetical protein
MLYGQIKPTVVKLFKTRLRYRLLGVPFMKPLRVIGWDMRHLLVADERVIRAYRVLWEDVQLVESERIMQVSLIQTIDQSKVVDRRREKKSFFKSAGRSE